MKRKLNNLIFAALFTAIICVFAQIAFPTPFIPITLQIFGVCLCGYFLSLKYSLLSVLVYILLGAIGLPVFYSFQGGAQHIFSLTGGFIIGFIPLCVCCSLSAYFKKDFLKILFGISGVLLCHFIGALQYSLISNNGLFASVILVSLPFLTKDIPLTVISFYLSKYLKRYIQNKG